MARIVVGSYLVRYPLGGMMSYVLQYLLGFARLGHEVYFVEKAGYPLACFDPTRGIMTDDCTYGAGTVHGLLARFGLGDRWCFVDVHHRYLGLSQTRVRDVLDTAELFLDMGTHGAWLEEARGGLRVLLEGEPGFTQMKMARRLQAGDPLPPYDRYYSCGANMGTPASSAPTAGVEWRHLWHPVVTDTFLTTPSIAGAPFTTVMNWQSHDRLEYGGVTFGQKDLEFERFVDLPRRTAVPLEIAVSGKDVPRRRLAEAGWRVRDAHAVTISCESYADYIQHSRGEFGVCKQVFRATNSGWFSDRSAAYLASGRPVVLQDTGFSAHLPVGRGLFAVNDVTEAAAAIDAIEADPVRQSRWARDIAEDCFEATKILGAFLEALGLERRGRAH